MLIPGASEKKRETGGGRPQFANCGFVRSFFGSEKRRRKTEQLKKILALVCKPLPLPFRSATADLPIF